LDPRAASLAALVVLQRKGRVLDAMTDMFETLRQRDGDRHDSTLFDQLRRITAELAKTALSAEVPAEPDDQQRTIAVLETQREQLEAALSVHSAEFRADTQAVTVETVQSAIPEDAALLEYAVFRPFDPRAERNAEAFGPPHYAAYVVR